MTEGLRRDRFLCTQKLSKNSEDYMRKYQVDVRNLRALSLKYISRKHLTLRAILAVG